MIIMLTTDWEKMSKLVGLILATCHEYTYTKLKLALLTIIIYCKLVQHWYTPAFVMIATIATKATNIS